MAACRLRRPTWGGMSVASSAETSAAGDRPELPAPLTLPRPHVLVLYLGIPLLIAAVMAWNPTGQRAPLMPGYLWATLYWMGILLPLWVLLDACTRALQWVCEVLSVRPPLLLLLAVGAILATLPMRGYLIYYWALVDRLLDPANARAIADLPGMWPESVSQFLATIQRAGVLLGVWVAVNYFYARMLHLPRYGYVFADKSILAPARPGTASDPVGPADASAQDVLPPALAERMSRHLGTDIIALQAQDHYVRVVTPLGAELILYRFCDAVRELPPQRGVRVHRSYWVARAAVEKILHRRGRHYVLLNNGERVPVSRTYLADVRRALG